MFFITKKADKRQQIKGKWPDDDVSGDETYTCWVYSCSCWAIMLAGYRV
ncbi:hypothetical protein FORC066_0330 [Yersinia enterocolitica]|nr:hypothetical protein FORC065_0297 [Yersinia enterocolitica]UXD27551.1 hypothetical protein FORC066_0330 [Yersinia enterocolitica]